MNFFLEDSYPRLRNDKVWFNTVVFQCDSKFFRDLVNISPGQEEKLEIKLYLHLTKDLL